MGIPIDEDYEFGNNCVAGEGSPHYYWLPGQTPKTIYATFAGMVWCPLVSPPKPKPPNSVTFAMGQTNGCSWLFDNGIWRCSFTLNFPKQLQLYYVVPLPPWLYYRGYAAGPETIFANVVDCAWPNSISKDGHGEIIWSVAPTKILFDYNLCSVPGTRLHAIPIDADTSQYRFANKEANMNIWVEYDHS